MLGLFLLSHPPQAIGPSQSASRFHEIKYDGYRLRVERDGGRVRLITRGGYDWTKRYSLDHRGRAQGQAEEVCA
jgi:ATP-dependent DNA ligase